MKTISPDLRASFTTSRGREVVKGALKPLSKGRLLRVVRKLRGKGKRIAFTNGCFDILHVGHLRVFEEARKRADCLIVGINSDASVRRLKGATRPVVPAKERARLVLALKPVDYVTIFSEETPLGLIQAIAPDLLVKGGDWAKGRVVGADVVRARGGTVAVIPYLSGHSTSKLLRRIGK